MLIMDFSTLLSTLVIRLSWLRVYVLLIFLSVFHVVIISGCFFTSDEFLDFTCLLIAYDCCTLLDNTCEVFAHCVVVWFM